MTHHPSPNPPPRQQKDAHPHVPVRSRAGSETMPLVHIVLFEFKPSTERVVVQDVSDFSWHGGACGVGLARHAGASGAVWMAWADITAGVGLQTHASSSTRLRPSEDEGALHPGQLGWQR
jgi:hypothetical protein